MSRFDYLDLIDPNYIESKDIYLHALQNGTISENHLILLLGEYINNRLGDVPENMKKYILGGGYVAVAQKINSFLENEQYIKQLENTLIDAKKFIPELLASKDPREYVRKIINILLDEYGFHDKANYEKLLSIYKGNTLEEKLKEMSKANKMITIDDDMRRFISEAIWNNIKHNFITYPEQVQLKREALFKSLYDIKNEPIRQDRIYDFIEDYTNHFNKSMLEYGDRIGMVTAVTLFQDLQQGAMKNFSNVSKLGLGIRGETPQTDEAFNSIINLNKNPPDPRTIVQLKKSTLDDAIDTYAKIVSFSLQDIAKLSIVGDKVEIILDLVITRKYEIIPSKIIRKIKVLETVDKVDVRIDKEFKIIVSSKIGNVTASPLIAKLYKTGAVQELYNSLKLLIVSGIEAIKKGEIADVNYGKLIQGITSSDVGYHVYLDLNLLKRFNVSIDKMEQYIKDRLEKEFTGCDIVLTRKENTINIGGLYKNEKISRILMSLPFYVNISKFIDDMEYDEVQGCVNFQDIDIKEAYVLTMGNRKMNKEDFMNFKRFKGYYFNFDDGKIKKGKEIIDAKWIQKYEGVKYIDQKFSNKFRIWYLIVRPIGKFKDYISILKVSNVDKNSTICNDPHIIFKLYGINALQGFLVKEISNQISTDISIFYSILTAKSMTSHGIPISATITGLSKIDSVEGLNSKSTFYEQIVQNIVNIAAVGGLVELEKNISNFVVKDL